MLLNPETGELFTNDGQFIQKLNCYFKVDWEKLKAGHKMTDGNKCAICAKSILAKLNLSENELIQYISKNPDTCLQIATADKELVITDLTRQEI